jgi:hypothetical protein
LWVSKKIIYSNNDKDSNFWRMLGRQKDLNPRSSTNKKVWER